MVFFTGTCGRLFVLPTRVLQQSGQDFADAIDPAGSDLSLLRGVAAAIHYIVMNGQIFQYLTGFLALIATAVLFAATLAPVTPSDD